MYVRTLCVGRAWSAHISCSLLLYVQMSLIEKRYGRLTTRAQVGVLMFVDTDAVFISIKRNKHDQDWDASFRVLEHIANEWNELDTLVRLFIACVACHKQHQRQLTTFADLIWIKCVNIVCDALGMTCSVLLAGCRALEHSQQLPPGLPWCGAGHSRRRQAN